jgi:hypothetical protein
MKRRRGKAALRQVGIKRRKAEGERSAPMLLCRDEQAA